MSVENDIKSLHKEIQKNIIVMLPEKYKKVCLYASVIDGNQVQNGEMFFYYFPSGILKKNPINVYQIPKIFDFEEEQYAKLEKRLYESIKKLKKYCVDFEQNLWSNLTIIIEGTKYFVEYNYDDLINSEFDNYSRHIIWRYKYLDMPIESYTKKEREIIDRYFESYEYRNSHTVIYEENIYEKPVTKNKVTIYDSVESHDDYIKKTTMLESKNTKSQLVAMQDIIEKDNNNHIDKNKILEIQNPIKNQLLKNFIIQDENEQKENINTANTLLYNENNIIKSQLLNKITLNYNKEKESIKVSKIIEQNKNNGVKSQLLNRFSINNNNVTTNTITSQIIEQEKNNGAKNQLLNF